MTGQSFPARFRLRHTGDFDRVYRKRCTASDAWLLVFACENGLTHARLGLSVSRKVGPAVVRNRWKRRLREAFRLNQHRFPPGMDLVVVPRGPGQQAKKKPGGQGRPADRDPAKARPESGPSELEFQTLCESLLRLAERVARKARRGSP